MVVLITGTTGIGEATAELASERGWQVFLVGLHESKRFPHLVGDLTLPVASAEAVRLCLDSYGRIDALFNVAGLSGRSQGDGPVHECTEGGWQFTVEANLDPTFLMSRAVLRQMMMQEPGPSGLCGSILNMSSVLARHPEPEHFATHAYAAAKGAIEALTRSMAACYAAQKIRVNAIAPGLTRTLMSRRAQENPSVVERMKSKQPLAEGLLDPTDIARTAIFLLSDESRHITGQTLTVDAGWSFS